MDGYEKQGLNEDDFGAKGGIVSAFDAFPKSKPQYVTKTSGGGKWTVAMLLISSIFLWTEIGRWWRGAEYHTFAVEKGVGHDMQVNLDIVVKMDCNDLHVNVQDASGDRILAGDKLTRDATTWHQWVDAKGMHTLGKSENGKVDTGAGWHGAHDEGFGEEHVHDIVALSRRKAKWAKTPSPKGRPDSCRMYGSLDLNKVQGDFHITARGHGYGGIGQHLEHDKFNFSHIISEMSYGPFYPSLVNPLDRTVNTAIVHFHKFQYYLSVVPTVYLTSNRIVNTNQYAVTEQSKTISDHQVPGIFFKYDIEPIMLNVEETRDGFFTFLIKIVNIFSGVMVAGHWGFTLSDWVREVIGKRRRSNGGVGFLGTKHGFDE
ncbi:DUF1692 domain-containing protein [Trichoderma barbatum]